MTAPKTAPEPLPEVSTLALRLASRALRRDVDGSSPARELWRCRRDGCYRSYVLDKRPTSCGDCGCPDFWLEGIVLPPPPALDPAQELHALAKDVETFAELVDYKQNQVRWERDKLLKDLRLADAEIEDLRLKFNYPINAPARAPAKDEAHELSELRRTYQAARDGEPADYERRWIMRHASLTQELDRDDLSPLARGYVNGLRDAYTVAGAEAGRWRAACGAPEVAAGPPILFVCSSSGCPNRLQPTLLRAACGLCGAPREQIATPPPPAKYVCISSGCPRNMQPTTSSASCGACKTPRMPLPRPDEDATEPETPAARAGVRPAPHDHDLCDEHDLAIGPAVLPSIEARERAAPITYDCGARGCNRHYQAITRCDPLPSPPLVYRCMNEICKAYRQPSGTPGRCSACSEYLLAPAAPPADENLAAAGAVQYFCSKTNCPGSARPARTSGPCHRCGAPRLPATPTGDNPALVGRALYVCENGGCPDQTISSEPLCSRCSKPRAKI